MLVPQAIRDSGGQPAGSANGLTPPETNGRAAGHVNGTSHTDGASQVNGASHANGVATGKRNGHRNGHANGSDRALAGGLRATGVSFVPPVANGHGLAAFAPADSADGALLVGATETWGGAVSLPHSPAPAPSPSRNGHAADLAAWAWEVRPRTDGFYARAGKRLTDVAGAVAGFLLLGPVMLAFAALIKLTSRGPVLYRSTRLGKDGRPFTFYKFRSMYVGADRDRDDLQHLNECDGPTFKISRDPRTTALGRFMRTTSVDELPQFINVLRGEMSLVGPRPPLPDEEQKYEPWQRRRLEVKPGLTCLWQISGRSRLGFEEWMRLDLEYIKHQSFATDLRILLRTIPAVLSRDGAY